VDTRHIVRVLNELAAALQEGKALPREFQLQHGMKTTPGRFGTVERRPSGDHAIRLVYRDAPRT
jgi:hypothetical protein